jgi:diaminohydroxyphosphoribosylaminopyrimidine deaminase/5-amino-6-(5-phosphoribosylamino)uracil reductase
MSPKSKSEQKPVWITNSYSRQLVHKWRSEEQAILVGTQTVVDDNPQLNIRDWTGNNPIRIVIDRNNRISKESHIFDNQTKTIVFSSNVLPFEKELVQIEEIDFEKNIAAQIVAILYLQEIQSVIVEGGRQTLQTFIDANLWDEAKVFKGMIDLKEGTPTPILKQKSNNLQSIQEDQLLIFRNYD